jgi:DNA-binding transcriptional LysR family regulator
MFSRAALYFDEVARRGSIRRASESLNIAASAVDRQILLLEDSLGAPLFERLPQGVRLTAAGEALADGIRRWRRDFGRIKTRIDDLRGLRRGEISLAFVEGAIEFVSRALRQFQEKYPSIVFHLKVAGAQEIVNLVLNGEVELGLTFNAPKHDTLRVERTQVYPLGAAVLPDHPLAGRAEIAMDECADYPLIIPDENLSLRSVFNAGWAKCVGAPPALMSVADSINVMKSMVRCGMGVAILTQINIYQEIDSGELVFIKFSDDKIPLSVFSLLSANNRHLSVPSSLLLQHLSTVMTDARL